MLPIFDGLVAAATDLERRVEIISSAAVELEAQIGNSADNASHASRSLQDVASAMTQMTASIQEVARNAARASEMSSKTRENADDGKEKVRPDLESGNTGIRLDRFRMLCKLLDTPADYILYGEPSPSAQTIAGKLVGDTSKKKKKLLRD